ncbi:hypothetical protein VP01_4842g2 [Puccinia sorghi]|uniref:Uncharacterized protein n=1 Tax=Puccinia sorghi TaxID=27349 RepID=A0A0L6UPB6_9BASI|nr:hypothetical protein VP01_4842g2 [Puccinia sorghi]
MSNCLVYWRDMNDQDLEARYNQPPLYHFPFSQILLDGDEWLGESNKTSDDVAEADQATPTKEEINKRVKYYKVKPSAKEAKLLTDV